LSISSTTKLSVGDTVSIFVYRSGSGLKLDPLGSVNSLSIVSGSQHR
jgi:hypothetical protein